jgi:CheY-like chemotaxis protein
VTAHGLAGDRELCLSAGMNDYISKSIDKAELMETIMRLARESDAGHPEDWLAS